MATLALEILRRCLEQVDEIEQAASRAEADGFSHAAPILRRSAYVLAVAALDSYFHERGAEILRNYALRGTPEASTVANYVQSASATDVGGPQGESYIRLRLSFKTLVAPAAIDKLLDTCGIDAENAWLQAAFALSTRPDRLRRLQELVYDRRNLIAHEADWDMVLLDFRAMEQAHLQDCRDHVEQIATAMDNLI